MLDPKTIRNVAVIAHDGAGKTALTDVIAAGCDASGLLANKVSEKAAKVIGSDPVNVQKKVDENKGTPGKDKQ